MKIYTKELSKDLWRDFESFFEFKGKCSGCWCMNHRLPVGLDFEGEAAKLAMKQLVESERVHGVLAYVEGDKIPIGWASLDKKKTLPGHDCIEEGIDCRSSIYSIHCVTTRSDYKNKGVEKILAKEAVELAKKLKASEIESYPEPKSKDGEAFKTWNSFNGYQDNYNELGFTKIEKDFGSHSEFYHPMRYFLDINLPILNTSRLRLEPQSSEHVDKLFKPFQEKDLYKYIKRKPIESAEQLRKGIESIKYRMLPDKSEFCLNWVLISKESEECIGQVEVSLPVDSKSFYLAYTVFKDHWRKGFAKESCKEVINYMFKEWNTSKCIIEMDVRNTASIKLAESMGAERVSFKPKAQMLKGEWSDEYVYEVNS